MNDLEKIHSFLSEPLDRVNATIKNSLCSTNPMLKGIIEFFLEKKGKQIRPIFTFLVSELLGKPNDKTINGAAAIELLHNASLIHDDVIDNSEMRRNTQTINKLWDNQIAVLVGDFFVTSALERAISTQQIGIISAISDLGRQLAVGELDQIYNAQNNVLSEEAYIRMIELKTASLFITCAKIGGISVDAQPEDINRMVEFARLLGICFQIKDDTFDYYENGASDIGKPVEADLLEGKISLPLLHVLIEDQKVGDETYIQICRKSELSHEEIRSLIEYTNRRGGLEYANQYMNNLYNQSAELLKVYHNKEAIDNLLRLFRYVIERDH